MYVCVSLHACQNIPVDCLLIDDVIKAHRSQRPVVSWNEYVTLASSCSIEEEEQLVQTTLMLHDIGTHTYIDTQTQTQTSPVKQTQRHADTGAEIHARARMQMRHYCPLLNSATHHSPQARLFGSMTRYYVTWSSWIRSGSRPS